MKKMTKKEEQFIRRNFKSKSTLHMHKELLVTLYIIIVLLGIIVLNLWVNRQLDTIPDIPLAIAPSIITSETSTTSADIEETSSTKEVKPKKEEPKPKSKPKAKAKTKTKVKSASYPAGKKLTKKGGINYHNGNKETWYSQRVLPGGGLEIPGRYVCKQGLVRDKDNYIVVASSDLKKGSVISTSLGQGKVYDTGCPSGVVDIYTDW